MIIDTKNGHGNLEHEAAARPRCDKKCRKICSTILMIQNS